MANLDWFKLSDYDFLANCSISEWCEIYNQNYFEKARVESFIKKEKSKEIREKTAEQFIKNRFSESIFKGLGTPAYGVETPTFNEILGSALISGIHTQPALKNQFEKVVDHRVQEICKAPNIVAGQEEKFSQQIGDSLIENLADQRTLNVNLYNADLYQSILDNGHLCFVGNDENTLINEHLPDFTQLAKVNLNAPKQKIINDFKAWLDQAYLDNQKKKTQQFKPMAKDWIEHRIIPYLHLISYFEILGEPLSNAQAEQIIFPDCHGDPGDKIKKSTQKHLKQFLSNDTAKFFATQ